MIDLKFRVWNDIWHKFEYFEIGENDDRYGVFRVVANKYGVTVEQYTGLTDKNGKEIYEGDIVKMNPEPSPNKASMYKIVWDKTNAMFNMEKVEKNKCRSGCELTSYFAEDRFEVISNIHENKDLLK